MKNLKLFYLAYCPYCRRALKYIDELKSSDAKYDNISIEMIEESQNRALANRYDYYLVPCFYVDEKKVHEGVADKEDIKNVFDLVIE